MKKTLLVLALFMPMQLWAYVFPPNYVYKKWLDKSKKISTLSYQKVYFEIDASKQRGAVEKIEQVWIKRPGLMRIVNQKSSIETRVDLQRAIVINRGQKRKISVDQAVGPLELLWAYKKPDALMVRVNQFYTPVSQFQWFLFGNNKHWLQGQKENSFLLFSTQTYLPMMAKQKDRIEQFIYQSGKGSQSLLPQKIIQFDKKTPRYEILIQKVQINPSIHSSSFSTT